jgi:hypothetical protein
LITAPRRYLPELPADFCFCFFFCFLQCYHAFFVVFDWAAMLLCVVILMVAALLWYKSQQRSKKGE